LRRAPPGVSLQLLSRASGATPHGTTPSGRRRGLFPWARLFLFERGDSISLVNSGVAFIWCGLRFSLLGCWVQAATDPSGTATAVESYQMVKHGTLAQRTQVRKCNGQNVKVSLVTPPHKRHHIPGRPQRPSSTTRPINFPRTGSFPAASCNSVGEKYLLSFTVYRANSWELGG